MTFGGETLNGCGMSLQGEACPSQGPVEGGGWAVLVSSDALSSILSILEWKLQQPQDTGQDCVPGQVFLGCSLSPLPSFLSPLPSCACGSNQGTGVAADKQGPLLQREWPCCRICPSEWGSPHLHSIFEADPLVISGLGGMSGPISGKVFEVSDEAKLSH